MAAFDALLGQPQAVGLLNQAIAQQRLAPAYLFAGPPGVGRTLAARCFVATLFNSGQDSQAGNRQATLILITPTGDCLLPTLVSRCQRIPFYRLSQTTLAQVLQQTGHGAILEHPEILGIAQGSPGVAISSWQQLETMPPDLLQTLRQPPASLRQALEVGRAIAQTLDTEAQLWLVDYLQHQYWHQANTSTAIPRLQALEQTRRAIRSYVQPRLVWEVTLMRMVAPSSVT